MEEICYFAMQWNGNNQLEVDILAGLDDNTSQQGQVLGDQQLLLAFERCSISSNVFQEEWEALGKAVNGQGCDLFDIGSTLGVTSLTSKLPLPSEKAGDLMTQSPKPFSGLHALMEGHNLQVRVHCFRTCSLVELKLVNGQRSPWIGHGNRFFGPISVVSHD
jgi:hypothetical protein